MEPFATRLTELRKEKNLSMNDLAKKIEAASTMISKWERGKTTPSLPMIYKLQKFFGVSMDVLLGIED